MSGVSQYCRTGLFDSTSPNPTGISSDIVRIADQLQGSGAPIASLGVVGNVYTDVSTGNQYQKDSQGWHPTIALTSFIVIPDPLTVTRLNVDTIHGNSTENVQVDLGTVGIFNVGATATPTTVSVHTDGTVLLDSATASVIVANGLGTQVDYGSTAIVSTGALGVVGQTSLALSSNVGDVSLTASAGAINLSPAVGSGVVANAKILSTVGGAQYSSQADPTSGLSSQVAHTQMFVSGAPTMQWNAGNTASTLPLYEADGAAGAPSYTFSSDTSSGIYIVAPGHVSLAAGGAQMLDVSSGSLFVGSSIITAQSGTAAVPGYTFASDTQTGMYLPAAGQLGLSVGGVSKFTSTATQNLTHQSLLPSVDATDDLGSALLQFRTIYLVNVPVVSSDATMKKEIDTLSSELGLSFVKSLRPVSYKWKESLDEREHFGVIAQELEQSLAQRGYEPGRSSMVQVSAEGKYGISPDALIPCLIKAVQQLSAQVESLQKM